MHIFVLKIIQNTKCARGMGEQEIINVPKLANNNDLPYMQVKRQFGYQNFFMPPVIGDNSLENEMG